MKRAIALILALVTVLSLCNSCSLEHFSFDDEKNPPENTESQEFMTRAEWIILLGKYFGMDTCISMDPYYQDVSSSNAVFPSVQSCVEWEILDASEKSFRPGDLATMEFVTETAVKAAEMDYSGFDDAFAFANSKGYGGNDREAPAAIEDVIPIIDWALDAYNNQEFKEYQNVEFQDGLVDMADAELREDGTLVAGADSAALKAGDVIITRPTPDDPQGVARKVESVSTNEQGETVIKTVEPAMEEVYRELDFAAVCTVDDTSQIRTGQGVTLVSGSPLASLDASAVPVYLSGDDSPYEVQNLKKGKDLGFSINLSEGGLKFSGEYEALKLELEAEGDEDANTVYEKTGYAYLEDLKILGDPQTVKATEKFEAGWELEGSVELENFYVEAEMQTKKVFGVPVGIKSYRYKINYDVSTSLKFSGKLEKEFTIATVPIPVGGTGVTIQLQVIAKMEANGEFSVGVNASTETTVRYNSGRGFKKTQDSNCTHDLSISVSFEAGFGGKATISALGLKIIDFQLDIGFGVEGSATVTGLLRHEGKLYKGVRGDGEIPEDAENATLLCVDVLIYAPTISLSLGSADTLAGKFKLKCNWNIMDKSGGTFKSEQINLHLETGNGVVDHCSLDDMTYLDLNPETSETTVPSTGDETVPETTGTGVGLDVLDISDYAILIEDKGTSSLSVSLLPDGYTADDIVFRSGDESVVTISGQTGGTGNASCTLNAVSGGITFVTVSTTDGKFSSRCAVSVRADEKIELKPLD